MSTDEKPRRYVSGPGDKEAGDGPPRAKMTEGYLEGQFLIAMPTISEGIFERSVVYIWHHDQQSAMGIIINKAIDEISLEELFKELGADAPRTNEHVPVIVGGPVEQARGFVLHSPDYDEPDSIQVSPEISLTTSLRIIRAVGAMTGPERWLIALGYAGWSSGQLEQEIQTNSWLTCPADSDIIFSPDAAGKWEAAIENIGFDPSRLTDQSGHA